ncbi:MAG: hypothetical protein U0K53_02860 [Paludibacteraceae bacterium]|nr:hypothetical protein [Paludibacteraceae bacterium]
MNNIEKQIADYLYNFYYGKNENTSTLYSVIEYIAKKNNISISTSYTDASNYDVKGKDGYKIILFTLIAINKLEERGFIYYHKQGEPDIQFKEIDYCKEANDVAKISGDFAKYITDFHYYAIYVDETIKEFKECGFANLELEEARKQTKKATITLIVSVIALLLSVVINMLNIKC